MFQKQIFMLYKFLIALDVERLMGKVWCVWFLYQIIRHGEISFRSVKINVPTVYLKYHLVFVSDLLKTYLHLIADRLLLCDHSGLGCSGILHVLKPFPNYLCTGQRLLKLPILLAKMSLQHVWPGEVWVKFYLIFLVCWEDICSASGYLLFLSHPLKVAPCK